MIKIWKNIKLAFIKWFIRWVGFFQNLIGIVTFCWLPKSSWILKISKWYSKEKIK